MEYKILNPKEGRKRWKKNRWDQYEINSKMVDLTNNHINN